MKNTRREKLKEKEKADRSVCIPPSASFSLSLCPFIFFCSAHSYWHLRDFSLLLLVFSSCRLFFCSKGTLCCISQSLKKKKQSLSSYYKCPCMKSTVLVLRVDSPQQNPSGFESSQGKIHMNYNHHSSLSKSSQLVHMYSTLMARF